MRRKHSRLYAATFVTASGLGFSSAALAVSYVWQPLNNGSISGSWATSTNWTPNLPAIGAAAGDFADFSQLNFSSPSIVTLDANQTIGNISFGNLNTSSTPAGITLNADAANASDPSHILYLSNNPNYDILSVFGNETATINGIISDGNAATATTTLAKAGSGTLVLTGANTQLTGQMAINNGVLEEDFSAERALVNILGDSSTPGVTANATNMQFQGGELLLKGSPGATNSQTFSGGSAIAVGDSQIILNQNGASSLSLNLGAVTRTNGCTVDITLPTSGTVSVASGSVPFPGPGGLVEDINGADYMTVNGQTDWAAVDSNNNIVPGSSVAGFYTPSTSSSLSGNADVVTDVATGGGILASMRFNDAATGHTVDLGGGQLLTGGILVTPSAGGPEIIQNGSIVAAGTEFGTSDLVVVQANTKNPLTISASITDGTSFAGQLTKSGPGTLILSGANSYSSETFINNGTLEITGDNATLGDFNNLSANIEIAPAYGNTATLDIGPGATVNEDRMIIAGNALNFSGGSATLNMTGGTVNSAQWFTVGSYGSGTFNMSGGTVNENTDPGQGSQFEIGVFESLNGTDNFQNATAVVNLSGTAQINILNDTNLGFGTVNTNGNGTLNQNGGTITFYSDSGNTVGGTGGVVVGVGGAGVYTYNLNGGTVITPSITHASGTGIVNFNGGNVVAAAASTTFIAGLNQANIGAGGANINTNGFNETVPQSFQHAASLGSTPDGGLNKSGAGTMILAGTSTYTGPTTISGGTIQLAPPPPALILPVGQYTFDSILDTSNNPVTTLGPLADGDTVVNGGSGGAAMNGTISGTGITLVTGKYGNALHFDGTGGNGTIQGTVAGSNVNTEAVNINSPIIDNSSSANWTVSLWVQTTEQGFTMLSKSNSPGSWVAGNSIYYLGGAANTGAGSFASAVRFSGGFIHGTASVTDGNWHMITYVDNAGTKTIYVDGVNDPLEQTGFANADVSNYTQLGFSTDIFLTDGSFQPIGSLDEVNFFNLALTPGEVQLLMADQPIVGTGAIPQFLPATSPVNLTASGATFDMNGQSQLMGSLSGVSGSSVLLGGATLTLGVNNLSTTFAGSISGSGSFVKTGTGVQVFTGANTYTGTTTINSGAMLYGSVASMDNTGGGTGALSSVLVNSGGAIGFLGTGGITNTAFLANINTASTGALALTTADANTNLAFNVNGSLLNGLSAMAVGAVGTVTYTGTLTPVSTVYHLGGGGGTLIYPGTITGFKGITIGNTGSTGTVELTHADSISGGGGTATVFGGMDLQLGASFTASGVIINSGGTVDVLSNSMLLKYTGTNDPAATIRSELISGFNVGGAKWAGTGITSSVAAASPTNRAVGYADGGNAKDVANSGGLITSGEVLVKYTVAGDANLSGAVDLSDLVIIASDFGESGADWAAGDLNYDGNVDLSDLVIVASNFGASVSSVSSDFSGSFAAEWQLALAEAHGTDVVLPEPGTIAIGAVGAFGLLARRRRSTRSV